VSRLVQNPALPDTPEVRRGLEPVGLDFSIWPVFRAEIIAE
jgi:hypothetical protein